MRITYIFHGCFAIECDKCTIVINYIKGNNSTDSRDKINNLLKSSRFRLYVICSGSSRESFTPEIFKWQYIRKNVRYILPETIIEQAVGDNVTAFPTDFKILKSNGAFFDELIKINAMYVESENLALLICVDGKYLLHVSENCNNLNVMEMCMYAPRIDTAFLPFSASNCKSCMTNTEDLLKRSRIKQIIPMHFGEDLLRFTTFSQSAAKYNCKYTPCNRHGSYITI